MKYGDEVIFASPSRPPSRGRQMNVSPLETGGFRYMARLDYALFMKAT
jgi:hypothetical protein